MVSDASAAATAVPEWFASALATPTERGAVLVDRTEITYRAWGDRGAPSGVVLVHGAAAHAAWWDHIGPLLSQERRVVAIDLSGHGDSGRRLAYSFEQWADEVHAVAEREGMLGNTVVVGHSMGGYVALQAGVAFAEHLPGVVVVDTFIRDMSIEEAAEREERAADPMPMYPSREAALARFRLLPDQEGLPFVVSHVAQESVRRVEDGRWSWKFDPRIFVRPQNGFTARLSRVDGHVALLRAEHGLMSTEASALIASSLGRRVPIIEIPGARHHVMLDEPLALVTGLRAIFAVWAS